VAYSAEIAVKVNGLNSVKTLETSLNKISGKINAINKISVGSTKASRVEKEIAKSKEAQRVSMIQTRRVGDAIQREADKGLQTDKARAAIKRAAKADSQGQLKVAIEQRKIALEELQTQQKITEVVKSRTLTGFGPKSPVFGRSTQMDSAGNTAAILQDPTTKVSPVQQALQKMEERSAKNTKQAVLNRKKSLSLGKDIVRIKKQEATQNARNLKSEQRQTSQVAKRLQTSISPRGDFSRLSDRQSRNVEGRRTFMNNPFGRRGIRPTRGFDTQSALISGAFPLLFGQGPIGAIAGGLGGGIGGMFGTMGGFAGGIAATAIVQQIQSAISAIGELGRALGPFARDTKAVTSALGLQGSAQEAQLQLIEQTQGKTAAFNAAMNFMATQIGQEGVNSLKRFGENSRRITASLTLATTKFQAFGASLLNFILRISGAEKQLRKAEQERTVSFAASRGDETAKAIQAEQKRIDAIPKVDQLQLIPSGGLLPTPVITKVKSKEAEEAQEALDKRRELFTVREKERINLAKINSEQGAHVQTLEEEFALVNRVNELVKQGNEKGLAQKLAKNEQINKKAIENIEIRQDEVKQELEALNKIKIKNDEQKRTVDELKEKQKFLTEELKKQPGILDDMNDKTKSLHSEVDKVTEAFKELSVTIGEDIKEGIKGLIKGTSTLSDLLNNVADKFLDVALNQALFGDILGSKGKPGGGILGFLTGGLLAEGGRAAGGKSFIVGEKGPELFVPRSTGTVIPNNKLGGGGNTSVVVNVDASGSDVQGDEAEAKELGTLISVAVQGELLKQQRPGGLLSR